MEDSGLVAIDLVYEFSAPMFFDFVNGESEEDVRKAEYWFKTALSYAPSPCMLRIKTRRCVEADSVCDFSEAADSSPMASVSSDSAHNQFSSTTAAGIQCSVSAEEATRGDDKEGVRSCNILNENAASCTTKVELRIGTPTPELPGATTDSEKRQTAKKVPSLVKETSALKPKNQSQLTKAKGNKPSALCRDAIVKKMGGTPGFIQENQAVKRQRLEGGGSRKILNIKAQALPHKTLTGLTSRTLNLCPSADKTCKEDRKVYVREAVNFVSTAELVKKFQCNTRGVPLPHDDDDASTVTKKPRLKLTRPVAPQFETAQRVRPTKVKSSAELSEEMMAKTPKFKARPLNRKILEASSLPLLPRSRPQVPTFQEFHLETMARASQNAETPSMASTESFSHQSQWRPYLTEPRTPTLQTTLRARPAKVKSTHELELEEIEKAPKFKARPLNKKIFESKGDLGMFCNMKRQVTIPQEFHFETDKRIPLPSTVTDLFDKLSLNSERSSHHESQVRMSTPNPFHLHTEERGAEKERKFMEEVMQKLMQEERARVPKANPYPYSTDYPVIPPRPEPKQHTKPEPFQLQSLKRHEEERLREMEELQRMEEEAARMRVFKAQPILKEDPIPVHEKLRRPLTQVQEFELHVDHRAADRAEFDKKMKEKELMYKRYREESEMEKMEEEERALKQLRRTMVPHARTVPDFNNPFLPRKSAKETTKAKSPNLLVLQRREKRKQMGPLLTATSSPASQMR